MNRKIKIMIFTLLLLIFLSYGTYFLVFKNQREIAENNLKETNLVLNGVKDLTIKQGEQIDLLKDVSLNNKGYEISIKGTYDFNKKGTYNLTYVVKKDNFIYLEKPFTLVVNPSYEIYQEGGAFYVDGYLIVNKTYPLADNYGSGLTKETLDNYFQMQKDALNDGIKLFMLNGYRSYLDQTIIYNGYVQKDGILVADTYSARPGHSEHQSGLAMDLNSLDTAFENTKEGDWLNDNCYKYGFIIRYPKGKDAITGYMFEPWHIRFVGKELAKILYNDASWLTMEEYFNLTSQYAK